MYRKNVIKQAQDWLGIKEGSAGHQAILDTYNNHKPLARGYKVKTTDSWCAAFVSAVAIKTGSTSIIPTECSCGRMIQLMQQAGVWLEDESITPVPGDIIFYDWGDTGRGNDTGWPDHVGIVETIKDGVITVIEGNLNNAVGRRTIAVNGRYIRGYGRPKYKAEEPALLNDKKEAQTAPAVEYYPKYSGKSNSIVDALKSLGVNSAYTYRKQIAAANGITGYKGSAAQNSAMLNLLKQGKLIKA